MQTLGEILVIFDLARVRSLGRAAQRSASHPRRRIGRGGGGVVFFLRARPSPRAKV